METKIWLVSIEIIFLQNNYYENQNLQPGLN